MNWDLESKLAHKERVTEQKLSWEQREVLGENIYTDFCVWCNGYADEKAKTDAKVFARFLKENKVKINERQRQHIAKMYFGYVYDVDKQKWVKG